MKLGLRITHDFKRGYGVADAFKDCITFYANANNEHGTDPYAATRRAIVRAAAAIGAQIAAQEQEKKE